MPLTIIGAKNIIPKKSLSINEGSINLIIDNPIETLRFNEKDKDKLIKTCRDDIEKNLKSQV